MTEETAQKIIETLKSYDLGNKVACVFMAIWIVSMIAFAVYDWLKYKKLKQWKQEYRATLNEEQLKAVENYRKMNL